MLIELLSRTSGIPDERLLRISATASQQYKLYTVPKRTGGERLIEHPSRELKAIQRWVIRALINRFPVHDSATAYRIGSGIRENAERHRTSKYTNRYDFMNFFPSFRKEHISIFIKEQSDIIGIDLSERDIDFIANIVCRNGRLTIGAPSSPAITNAMMFAFDKKMHDACKSRDLIFTRYADDIFISASEARKLFNIENLIIDSKRDIHYLNLRINHKKTAMLSKKYHRSITGVVITPQHTLSIGRDRKREIKSLIHRWINGQIDAEKTEYLKGLFSYAIDIEPSFETRLIDKYGADIIKSLRSPENAINTNRS
ncbi:retron St85 family RNA-directed DNA polymerase [Oceanibaculum indicum]|uniref:Retron-type reverse transcriptase n=1 Tax=Oceanibaculum indicum TaxID=526216 RepID=A0A420W9Z6_9PROT|nr:retron St85 family RNA-directed DNA polymerase [Oceanibaculum indicum]RKQ64151.1 retron-type reverse transcriptase [Oceanibaculum indicum]